MYLRCWVPNWLMTGHGTPACSCKWSQEIVNILLTLSFHWRWDRTIFVFIIHCSISKLMTLKPLRCNGPCWTAVAVVQLMPMHKRNVGRYFAWSLALLGCKACGTKRILNHSMSHGLKSNMYMFVAKGGLCLFIVWLAWPVASDIKTHHWHCHPGPIKHQGCWYLYLSPSIG